MKLNILIIFVIIIGILFLGFRVLGQTDTYVNIQIMGSSNNSQTPDNLPPAWLADTLNVGDSEKSVNGKKIAELVDIERYQEGDRQIYIATVRLLVSLNKTSEKITYKQQGVEIGSRLSFSLDNSKISGQVVEIEGLKTAGKWVDKNITVKLYDRYPWFADSITIGDKLLSGGATQVEVLTKKTSLAEISTGRSDGRVVSGLNPLKRDITLTLKVRVLEREGVNYFAYIQPVKIGNILYMPMSNYNLYEANVLSVADSQ